MSPMITNKIVNIVKIQETVVLILKSVTIQKRSSDLSFLLIEQITARDVIFNEIIINIFAKTKYRKTNSNKTWKLTLKRERFFLTLRDLK